MKASNIELQNQNIEIGIKQAELTIEPQNQIINTVTKKIEQIIEPQNQNIDIVTKQVQQTIDNQIIDIVDDQVDLTIELDNQITKITKSKKLLISRSKYFENMFCSGFKTELDSIKLIEVVECDISYVVLFFDLLVTEEDWIPENKFVVNIEKNNKFSYDLEINYGIDIPIYEYYIMIQLGIYFVAERFLEKLNGYLDNFYNFVVNFGYHCRSTKPDQEGNFKKTLKMKVNNIGIKEQLQYDNKFFGLYFSSYSSLVFSLQKTRRFRIETDIIQNVHLYYLVWNLAGKVDDLKKIIDTIDFSSQSPGEVRMLFNGDFVIKKKQVNSEFVRDIPIDKLYDIFTICKHVIDLDTALQVYDFYDAMIYEGHEWETFGVLDHSTMIGQRSVHELNDVLTRFRGYIIFDGFDWNGVVIAGGFVAGLLYKLHNSVIGSTDIDLFLFGPEQETKMNYILEYFSKYKPFYSRRGPVVTIIIQKFQFDIQVIPTKHYTPYDIIKEFDLSYIMLYFDGDDFYGTLSSIVSLKYGLAMIYKKEMPTMRLYKTISKGFDIKYDPELKNKYIDGKKINPSIHQSKNIQNVMTKQNMIRRVISVCTENEALFVIKSCYNSSYVTTDNNNVFKKMQVNEKSDYNLDWVKLKKSVIQAGGVDYKLYGYNFDFRLIHLSTIDFTKIGPMWIYPIKGRSMQRFLFRTGKISLIRSPFVSREFIDKDCNNIFRITLDTNQEECNRLMGFLKRMDDFFESDGLMDTLFSKYRRYYQYQTIIRTPNPYDDEDNARSKSKPRPIYCNMKLKRDPHNKIITQFIKVEGDKRTEVDPNSFDIFGDIWFMTTVRVIFCPEYVWAAKIPRIKDFRFKECSVTLRLIQVEFQVKDKFDYTSIYSARLDDLETEP